MSATVQISSSAQFSKLLSSSSVVIVDFYADWCGPCKAVAPTYESLSTKYSKPNRITFTKVNVDNQSDISQKYGVRAMPTFMIFRSGSVIETIQGANVAKLTSAIEAAVRSAGVAKQSYATAGRKLGGEPIQGHSLARKYDMKGWLDTLWRFFGLYLWTLFSLDAYQAGENSSFNVNRVAPTAPSKGAKPVVGGRKVGTIADFGN